MMCENAFALHYLPLPLYITGSKLWVCCFSIVDVAENLLYSSSTNSLRGNLCFGVRLHGGLQVGCSVIPQAVQFLTKQLFSLYVGKTVLEFPHVCSRGRLLFVVATFFCVCFGVGYRFFSTRPTWLHVETVRVWM